MVLFYLFIHAFSIEKIEFLRIFCEPIILEGPCLPSLNHVSKNLKYQKHEMKILLDKKNVNRKIVFQLYFNYI